MLKSLHKNDTQITPFIVTKNWELSNVTNEDLILMEHSGSDGFPVAIEYLDYGLGVPTTASCNLAKENQEADRVTFKSGLKVSGLFYPDTDPQNEDGTYQRVVYAQVVQMFYNNYRDPTKMWGLEEIDFEKSQTKKFVSDKFKMFEIPQGVFGEKILENTITLYDTTTDNNYIITDDGNCNLFAGTNLFSHQQEVGNYLNQYFTGSDSGCDLYNTIFPPNAPVLSLFYSFCSPAVFVTWDVNYWPVTEYLIEKSLDGVSYISYFSGSTSFYTDTNITYGGTYWYRAYAINLLGTSPLSNTASIFASTSSFVWDITPEYWDSQSCALYWSSSEVSPTPPSDSIVLSVTSGSAILDWVYADTNQDGFNVEKSTDGVTYSNLITLPTPSIRTYTDTAVSGGNTYWYRVNAYNNIGTSSYSNVVDITFDVPSICGDTPTDIQNTTWVVGGGTEPPCADFVWNSGSATWYFKRSYHDSPCNSWVDVNTTICNPGESYPITVTIPWEANGNVIGTPPYPVSFTLDIGGVTQDNQVGDMASPTTIVLTGTVPATTANIVVRLYFASGGVSGGLPDGYTIASTTDLTITPLTHP